MDKALIHLSKNDPVMKDLIDRYPVPTINKHTKYYEQLVSSIIGQQLSVHAAKAIKQKFISAFGGTFPSPDAVIEKDTEIIQSAGLGRSKTKYIQDLAAKVIDGTVTFEKFDAMTNEEIISELIKVKGIGEWTAHMFLMFSMARLDVLPVGDLGVRNGITKLYNLPEMASFDDVSKISKEHNWHPYETVASLYVWLSLKNVTLSDIPGNDN